MPQSKIVTKLQEEGMDSAKFLALWEYASPGATVTEEDVYRVCCMYFGSAVPNSDTEKAQLRNAIQQMLSSIGSNNSDTVMQTIVKGGNELADLLGRFSNVTLSSKGEKKDNLRTILDDNLDDDEDDESVNENDQEEEKQAGLTILMRGFLKKKDNKVEWSGNWAMTTEAFDSGDKAKFRYEMRGDSAGLEERDGKVLKVPKTAIFDGSFLVKDQSAASGFVRLDEKAVTFEFEPMKDSESKWKIRGKGQNVNGEFTLEGELDGTSRRLAVFKTYYRSNAGSDSSDDSASDLEEDEEEIDPTELEDLKADQRESFGRVLAEEDEGASGSSKKKKRRMVEG